jgi:WD40 repeat protein
MPPEASDLKWWEFTDTHPSGRSVWYRLEKRSGLSLRSDDPMFDDRLEGNGGPKVLSFVEYLVRRAGERCDREEILKALWSPTTSLKTVDTYLGIARTLLDDDGTRNRRGEVLSGRIIESLSGSALRFALPVNTNFPNDEFASISPFASVPPPDNYLGRPDVIKRIRDKLFGARPTVAIEGMPGAGKTMVAIGLCHDPDVRARFRDGIVWLRIGRQPPVLNELFKRAATLLKCEFRDDSEDSYRSLFDGRTVLVVLDNVWRSEDIVPFRIPNGPSRLLYTTRHKWLSASLRADAEEVGLLEPEAARGLFSYWLDHDGSLPEIASEIIDECGGLALALSMVGAALQRKSSADWADMLSNLRAARLNSVRSNPAGYEYAALDAAIAVSVDDLELVYGSRRTSKSLKDQYLSLALWPDNVPIPEGILQTMWGVTAVDVRESSSSFVDRSLARTSPEGLVLHDLQFDYVRSVYPDPNALGVIQAAIRLSSHVIMDDPYQFSAQLLGRLNERNAIPPIPDLLHKLAEGAPRPWLHPITPSLTPPGGPLIRTLVVKVGGHWRMKLSDDGQRLEVTNREVDGGVQLFDLDTFHELGAQTNTLDEIVALSSDGRLGVWDSEDRGSEYCDEAQRIEVREIKSGQVLHCLRVSGFVPWAQIGSGSVAINVRATHLFIVSVADGVFRIWDLKSGREVQMLEHPEVEIASLSTDAHLAISASGRAGTVRVWEVESGRLLLEFNHPRVDHVLVSSDATIAIAASDYHYNYGDIMQGALAVWDLTANREVMRLSETLFGNWRAINLPAGVAVFMAHDVINVWNLKNGALRCTLNRDLANFDVTLSHDGNRIISASDIKPVKVWDSRTGKEVCAFGERSRQVGLSRDGKLAFIGAGGAIKVFRVRAQDRHQQPVVRCRAIAGTAIGHVASMTHQLIVSDADTGMEMTRLDDPAFLRSGKHEETLALSEDGTRVVVYTGADDFWLWDLAHTQEGHVFHHSDAQRVVVNANLTRALSQSEDGEIVSWDLTTGREMVRFRNREPFFDLAMSADGAEAVTWGVDSISRWDCSTGENLSTVSLDGIVQAVCLNSRVSLAVVTNQDHTMIWDVIKEREVCWLADCLDGGAWTDTVMSSDGELLAQIVGGDKLRLWNLRTEARLGTFTSDHPLSCCAFAGNQRIATGDDRGNVHFLKIDRGRSANIDRR